MRLKEVLDNTTNSKEYRKIVNKMVNKCGFCSIRKGCNRNRKFDNSWKTYRKTQWRD